ncbi:MAG: EscU/YscU/HrcU family type III secretion system export apparatus switch protein [Nitrospiraceae bacterium]|nr:MAG: EscU/YscU/HrcU family type III secretion system export apparatus switch protein [Nitrospiraceae bacterium]
MAEEFQEKTEQATPRKKQKAREKGKILRDKDLVSMAATGGMLMVFYFGGEYFFISMSTITASILGMKYGTNPIEVSRIAIVEGSKIMVPFMLVSIVLVIFTSVVQSGWAIKSFSLDFQRANPMGRLKSFFSPSGVTNLLKSILKFIVGAWVVYYIIRKDLKSLPLLSAMELNALIKESARMITHAVGIAFLYYLIVAFVGFLFEKWQYEKSLRMTRQEVKEEHKEMEGDPLIKSRIRSIQKETARKRMMQEVPKATVVITNPTHLAIALVYEEKKMFAPKIIAKGAGVVAEKIREIAGEHGVPIVEDKPLARALFKLDIDTFIPEELYVAVAKILAYIYKIKGNI